MDNIHEKDVFAIITDTANRNQQSQHFHFSEEMEVSDGKLLTESGVILVNPTPQEMDVTDKFSKFKTSTNQNSSSLNILNQYGSSSSSECDDSSDSSSSSDSSDSSSESDCDEDELILNMKSSLTDKIRYIKQ